LKLFNAADFDFIREPSEDSADLQTLRMVRSDNTDVMISCGIDEIEVQVTENEGTYTLGVGDWPSAVLYTL
jgi:hypothetical protein